MSQSFSISREALYKDLWKTALSTYAKLKNVPLEKLKQACKDNNIPTPSPQHWKNIKRGIPSPVAPLPSGENVIITIPTVKHRNGHSHLSCKAYDLCILKILETFSDENKAVTTNQIIKLMEKQDLHIDRRTVYASIKTLKDVGYDISDYNDNGVGYKIDSRAFSMAEVKLLLDSLSLNPYKDTNTCMPVIKKLRNMISATSWDVRRNLALAVEKKFVPEDFHLSLDTIDIALMNNLKIEFDYTKFDINGNLVPYREESFVVAPYWIFAMNHTYYLVTSSNIPDTTMRFRIDRIRNVRLTDKHFDPKHSDRHRIVIGEYAPNHIDGIVATLRCSNDLLEKVMDNFSDFLSSVKLTDNNDGTFTAKIDGGLITLSEWAASVADKCEVLSPPELREAVINKLKNNVYGV